MSERALRDQIEELHAAILAERAKLSVPVDQELSETRAALQAEVASLTQRSDELADQVSALEAQTRTREWETKQARSELSDARSEISSLEPLGNPLKESRSNWEDPETAGCAMGVLALVVGATAAAGWWLS